MADDPKYSPYIIKEYTHWKLFLNKKQYPYVGRCYAWWKKANSPGQGENMLPSDLSRQAWLELLTIFDEVVDGCRELGHQVDPYGEAFRLNMGYYANLPEHNGYMHWHFVPRFKQPLVLEAINLRADDFEWGGHYARPKLGEHELDEEKLQSIRLMMARAIHGNLY